MRKVKRHRSYMIFTRSHRLVNDRTGTEIQWVWLQRQHGEQVHHPISNTFVALSSRSALPAVSLINLDSQESFCYLFLCSLVLGVTCWMARCPVGCPSSLFHSLLFFSSCSWGSCSSLQGEVPPSKSIDFEFLGTKSRNRCFKVCGVLWGWSKKRREKYIGK